MESIKFSRGECEAVLGSLIFKLGEEISKITRDILSLGEESEKMWSLKPQRNSLRVSRGQLKIFKNHLPKKGYDSFGDFLKIGKIQEEKALLDEKEKNGKISADLKGLPKNRNISYQEAENKIEELKIEILFTHTFNFLLSKVKKEERVKFIDTCADKYFCQLDEISISYLLENNLVGEIPRLVIEKDVVIGKTFINKLMGKYPNIDSLEILNIYLLICADEEEIKSLLEKKEVKLLIEKEVKTEIEKKALWKKEVIIEYMKKKFGEKTKK